MVLRDPDGAIEELDRKARQSFSKVSVAVEAENSLEAPLSDADGLMAPLEKVTEAQKRAEAETILAALNRCRWNRKQAAVALHVDYKALLYKMKKLGIDRNPVEAAAAC